MHPPATVQKRCGPYMLTKDSLKSAYNKKDEEKSSPRRNTQLGACVTGRHGKEEKRKTQKLVTWHFFPFRPRAASGKCVETSFPCSEYRAWNICGDTTVMKASVTAGHGTCPARSANTYMLWDPDPIERWQFIMYVWCYPSDQIEFINQVVSYNGF